MEGIEVMHCCVSAAKSELERYILSIFRACELVRYTLSIFRVCELERYILSIFRVCELERYTLSIFRVCELERYILSIFRYGVFRAPCFYNCCCGCAVIMVFLLVSRAILQIMFTLRKQFISYPKFV